MISTSHQRVKNTRIIFLWHFRNCDDADSQRLTFRRSFVECHFLHTAQFLQAQTCQPATTMSAATIQLLFSTPLSDCLSTPLTLTWTLISKTEAAVRQVACGYLNVCTHRFLTWRDHHTAESAVHAYTQQNHIVWITKHSSRYYESNAYLMILICSSYSPFLSLSVYTVPSFTFTPTGTYSNFHLLMSVIFYVFGK